MLEQQELAFGKRFLDSVSDWVADNLGPEKVYLFTDTLTNWARDNGYVAGDKLDDWALENGYVKET